AGADRVAQTAGFHVGPAAALGPYEAAIGERRERAADGMPIHAEPLRDLDLSGQSRVDRIAAVRDRALELIGDPPPQRDPGGLRRGHRAIGTFHCAVFHGCRHVGVIKPSRADATKLSSNIDILPMATSPSANPPEVPASDAPSPTTAARRGAMAVLA